MAMDIERIIREHCVRKLAQIIFYNFRCKDERTDLDWVTAGKYIDSNFWIVKNVVKEILENATNKFLKEGDIGDYMPIVVECGFKEFDKLFGQYIWEKCYEKIKPQLPSVYQAKSS